MLRAVRSLLGENDMMAYLTMMAIRLLELKRVLKPTGCIYLHCDPSASHYIKIMMDGIFGNENFRNEIIWPRTNAHNFKSKTFARVHDVIFFYSVGKEYAFNQQFTEFSAKQVARYELEESTGRYFTGQDMTIIGGDLTPWRGTAPNGKRGWGLSFDERERLWESDLVLTKKNGAPRLDGRKVYLDDKKGVPIGDVWNDIKRIANTSGERLGYPTQKPVELLERIIKTSSNDNAIVLDPFCGCGTTIHAAQKLGRTWIGIDVTHLAISLIERRLKDAFPGIAFDVHGTPKDLDGARDLALRDKYQFQWWAISLIDARPYGGKKKGADGGIDGLIYFRSDANTTERAIVSVKGGGVSVPMIRDLKGVLDREKAPIGVFLTLEPPTRPMEKEAASAGFYILGERQYPRIQIITIEQALRGVKPAIPLIDTGAAFKRAPREGRGDQTKLNL
jgi:site-specific DNA-methyltransferase (adenine-specific)